MNTTLHERARRALAAASVLAEAPGADFIPFGDHHHETNAPTGASTSLHDRIAQAFNRCRSLNELRIEVDRAETLIDRWRKGRDPEPETQDARDKRILTEDEGKPADEVANREGLNVQAIWRLRVTNGRSAQRGIVILHATMTEATRDERAKRARQLQDEYGLSARQIAIRLNVSHPTVLADLKRTEAA